MVNRKNYHYTRTFLEFQQEVKQLNPKSVGRYKMDLNHLLLWLDETSLEEAPTKRPTFPTFLSTHRMDEHPEPLMAKTQGKVLQTVKRFFLWLKMQYPRGFNRIPMGWLESLQPSPRIEIPHTHEFVTVETAIHLATFPLGQNELVIQRDQAAAAMLFLSGMRAGALVSLPIEAVDIDNLEIKQWPALGVRTKNRKHATTYLLNIPPLIQVVKIWDTAVREVLPPSAMWYTPITGQWRDRSLNDALPGKNRGINLNKRLVQLCQMAGVPYQSAHKFRHGHAVYALLHAKTMADYKAISQNLMHSNIKITDEIYAWLKGDQVKERIAGLSKSTQDLDMEAQFDTYLQTFSKPELTQLIVRAANLLAS